MSLPDLRGHGVVEAHAGTGKTYTIVATVLDLLVRERLELRQILLVTYTQKAAGELAERIRKGIARALLETSDPTLRAHLQSCLGQFAECWIGTIHGVALRILRTWPFESGLPFRTDLVDDLDGLETELRAVWRNAPFRLSDEEHALLRGEGRFAKLLERAQDLAQARLDPDAVVLPLDCQSPEAVEALRERRRGLPEERRQLEDRVAVAEAAFLELLRSAMGAAGKLDASGFSAAFGKRWSTSLANWSGCLRRRSARNRNSLFGKGKPIGEALATKDKGNPRALDAVQVWNALHEAWTSSLESDAARLAELDGALKEVDDEFRARVLSAWATEAARRWRSRKRAEGLLSYQDMLERLRDAVRDDNFRQQLRSRIRVGIIDEFQDTSALQWDVFRRWFVEDNPARDPRLLLVGDPKQSIYSFQGADVRTYLRACSDIVEAGGGRLELLHNWRSSPRLVRAINGLLLSEPDWFSAGIAYEAGNQVRAPSRGEDEPAADSWIGDPLRIVPIGGSSGARRAAWADHVAATILDLRGREARVPEGSAWTERVLDWGDFAIVAQTRRCVPAFRRALRRAGIPFSMYKESGVFASRAAREFSCLLAALAEPPSEISLRLRTLFTRFFGIAVDDPDPSRHLAPDAPATAVLDRLRALALEGRWALLFREMLALTGVQERMLAGEEGDRHWMDLRQTAHHALEFLVLGRGGIPELLEHLRRLERGDETAEDDRNLHARATDRGRVQILTMHVSKGLEFPVVFLAPAADPRRRSQNRWIAERDGLPRLHVAPKECGGDDDSLVQAGEESRRLLYVALTRPKLVLEVPYFLGRKDKPEGMLSRRLEAVVAAPPEGVRVQPAHPSPDASRAGIDARDRAAPAPRRDPSELHLGRRSLILSSYSAISRSSQALALEGRPHRAEENQTESVTTAPAADLPDAWLPRGAASGDALHEILEHLLRLEDLSWCRDAATPPDWLSRQAESSLSGNGLDPAIAPRVARLALDVLATPLPLPGGDSVRLCDLPRPHRRPEVEFHCAFDERGGLLAPGTHSAPHRGWLVGYIDLLFRHGGTWYVLDWKTTTLPSWDRDALDRGMREHDYLLQASLYARVVAESLPRVPCGGAVYVFLRAGAGLEGRPALVPGTWTAAAADLEGPLAPARLEAWLRSRRNPSSRGVAP